MMQKLDVPVLSGLFDPRDPTQAAAHLIYAKLIADMRGHEIDAAMTALAAVLSAVLFSTSRDLEHSLGKLHTGINIIAENLQNLHNGQIPTTRH